MYSTIAPFLKEEVLLIGEDEIDCELVMRHAMRPVERVAFTLSEWFESPILEYIEPDRLISLADVKKHLLLFFIPWRCTPEALDVAIEVVERGQIDTRVYFCVGEQGEPCIGRLLSLWWHAMPKDQRLASEMMYGNHAFERWLLGTRPGMTPKNTLYLAQLVFVLRECRRELFESTTAICSES